MYGCQPWWKTYRQTSILWSYRCVNSLFPTCHGWPKLSLGCKSGAGSIIKPQKSLQHKAFLRIRLSCPSIQTLFWSLIFYSCYECVGPEYQARKKRCKRGVTRMIKSAISLENTGFFRMLTASCRGKWIRFLSYFFISPKLGEVLQNALICRK